MTSGCLEVDLYERLVHESGEAAGEDDLYIIAREDRTMMEADVMFSLARTPMNMSPLGARAEGELANLPR